MKTPRLFTLLLLATTVLPSIAFAWGEEGHRIVAAIAARHLDHRAEKQIGNLLSQEEISDLPGISIWSDQHKNRYTAPMHYGDMPVGNCHYEPERDCPEGHCVVAAIERYSRELADGSAPRESRVIALKMLVHLVGDIHQPLHDGFAEDRGGNSYQIQWEGRGSNLHKLWDTQLIQSVDPDWQSYATTLSTTSPLSTLGSAEPKRWAEEACVLVNQPGFYPVDRKPGQAYGERWRPLMNLQLQRAGLRLARLLNDILG